MLDGARFDSAAAMAEQLFVCRFVCTTAIALVPYTILLVNNNALSLPMAVFVPFALFPVLSVSRIEQY